MPRGPSLLIRDRDLRAYLSFSIVLSGKESDVDNQSICGSDEAGNGGIPRRAEWSYGAQTYK